MIFQKIFITGGAGYVGSRLVDTLLEKGFEITVYDIMYFNFHHLPLHNKNLKIVKGDIRDTKKIRENCNGHDVFINLACISNDASFELNENLSTSINMDAFEPMVKAAKDAGIKRFIYASSSSVYGVSVKKNVTEDHPLVPLTLYNKYKGLCEPLLFKHTNNDFEGVIFRPATVCGWSKRLRLDLSVNILTNHAINNKKITVFGGDQLRPNLHIQDYCDCVLTLINSNTNLIENQIFNVGYQNLSIMDLAKIVKKVVEKEYLNDQNIEIIKTKSDDIRSYHINSDKIFDILGFKPKHTIEDAIEEICNYFKSHKVLDPLNNEDYFNVKKLKKINAT
jgi:nucleoside-diphosphate-sugar epimerase